MKTPYDARASLKAKSRFAVAGALEIIAVLVGMRPEWDYGLYDKTKFWYAADNFFKEFLVVLLPSMAIVFLLPVIVRGSFQQKIGAIVLVLPAALIAIPIWLEIIRRFNEIR
jgi:hypothetical protein